MDMEKLYGGIDTHKENFVGYIMDEECTGEIAPKRRVHGAPRLQSFNHMSELLHNCSKIKEG